MTTDEFDNNAALLALSPLDGRYAEQITHLRHICSEAGLIKQRIGIEIAWFIELSKQSGIKELPPLTDTTLKFLSDLQQQLNISDFARVKELEKQCRHDVKAVEYYLRERFKSHPQLQNYQEFIHFGCTSEDINSVAYGLITQECLEQCLQPVLASLLKKLRHFSARYAGLSMIARTHGQPASPTTLGKEFSVFGERLKGQWAMLQHIPITAKFSGASGNYNAHMAAYPELDWPALSYNFIARLGLKPNKVTTQIEPHDNLSALCHNLLRLNNILLDLCRDAWGYISLGYFRQQVKTTEVGSSTMPHKVNPIDFENAEGNLGIANALLQHLAEKLPISRWQRDLSDSTVMRNLGVVVGYCMVAWQNIERGLERIEADPQLIASELSKHPELLAEAYMTIARKYGQEAPYELMKKLTRTDAKTPLKQEDLTAAFQALNIPEQGLNELKQVKLEDYIGNAKQQALDFAEEK